MTPALLRGRGPRKLMAMGGWFGCAHHWLAMLDAIDPEAFQVAVFDYRGYGSRRDEGGAFTFEEAAHDVLLMADTLGWQRFSLAGHSMGGMAMQRVALAAPSRVERLVGLAPVSAAGSGFDGPRLAMFERAVHDIEARQRIVHFSTGQRLAAAWSAAIARDSWRNNKAAAMAAYLPQWTAQGFADEARTLSLPVLVLVGEHDPSINAASAERSWAVHHPQAVIEVVANAGHYPMQEVPIPVATRLQQWLAA